MALSELLLYFFGILAASSALSIVFTRNVLHAAFLLVLCLLSLAALYVLYDSNFLAVVQIMVYAGGVLVLMGFGIMLTNRASDGRLLTRQHLLLIGGVCTAVLLGILITQINGEVFTNSGITSDNQIELIGIGFMTKYILAFEMIAYLLLVVLVGAAYHAKQANDD